MDTYVILRRNGWPGGAQLEAAAARSTQVGDEEMSDDIRWIRSYVIDGGGRHARDRLHLPVLQRGEDPRARVARRPAGRRGHQGRGHGPRAAGSGRGRLSEHSPASAAARYRRSVAAERREHRTRSRSSPGGMDVLQVLGPDVRPIRERKPPWFKVPLPSGPRYQALAQLIKDENLHTVCQEAACPNVGECWDRGTATFMILGDTCTRRCGFCNVTTGKPTWNDPLEPARVARTIARMGLRHAVITSVDRDDLPDYGAGIWAATIRQVRRQAPDCQVEVLTPDFRGQEMPLARVLAERPDVFNHNLEVVPRLYPLARRGSRWERSLRVLRNAKALGGDEVVTKSGLMVGLGETHEEMVGAFDDLREAGVQVLTVGQYLRPTADHLPVVRYWHPDEFKALETRRLRARLRPHRRRAARALQLPRRPARPAGAARRRPARRRRRRLIDVDAAAPPRAGQHRAARWRRSRASSSPASSRSSSRSTHAPTPRRASSGACRTRTATRPSFRVFGDDRLIVNLSVWESVEALRAFVYTDRRAPRRAAPRGASGSTRWRPTGRCGGSTAGTIPTLEDAEERLRLLEADGPTPRAFTFRAPFAAAGREPRSR